MQQLTANMQAIGNFKRVIHKRVVDQALPAGRGAGLFKVDAHNNQQCVTDLFFQRFKSVGIVMGRFEIVNRAGADYNDQAVIFAL